MKKMTKAERIAKNKASLAWKKKNKQKVHDFNRRWALMQKETLTKEQRAELKQINQRLKAKPAKKSTKKIVKKTEEVKPIAEV